MNKIIRVTELQSQLREVAEHPDQPYTAVWVDV